MGSGGPEGRVPGDLANCGERIRRLEAVVEASQMVNSSLDLEELAEHIVDIACRLIGAERGSLFLADPQSRSLRAMVAQGLPSGSLTVEFEQGIVGAVAASGEAEILDDPYADPRFDQRFDRATGYRTRSLLTVPIRNREGLLAAVLQLLNRRAGVFSKDDVEFLAELGVTFAIALTTARLHAETVARERLWEEVRLAAEIQRALQPGDRAQITGLDLEAVMRPCLEVGGDYWDVIPRGSGRWWLVVADVSGKGVPAGLVASNIQACLWTRRKDAAPLTEVVADINCLLCRLTRGRKYATLVVCEWDETKHTLTWVGAGHPPLFIEASGDVREYASTGPPVGLLDEGTYGRHTVRLDEGDTVLVYTDGLLEAGGEEGGEEFGLGRIRTELRRGGGTAAVVSRLLEALGAHLGDADPADDVTLLCFRRPKVQ